MFTISLVLNHRDQDQAVTSALTHLPRPPWGIGHVGPLLRRTHDAELLPPSQVDALVALAVSRIVVERVVAKARTSRDYIIK